MSCEGGNLAVVPWPAEADRRVALAAEGSPRLLVLAEGTCPPPLLDCLEDWVRAPVDEGELHARLEALRLRVRCHRLVVPELDEEGFLRFRSRHVYLPPVEARLAGALLDRFGRVVGAATLMRAGWPGEPASRGKLDVRIHRLRRRLVPLGLEVKTVRQRGWLLAASESDDAVVVDVSDPEPGFQRDVTLLKHHQDRRETPAF
jgi:two-component system, OmpR family, response regulator